MHVDSQDVYSKYADFYSPFNVIIATGLDLDTLIRINEFTRRSNRLFYATDAHGFYGYIFADLNRHEYVIERERSNIPTTLKAETATRSIIAVSTKKESGSSKVVEMVTKREVYSPLGQVVSASLPTDLLRNRRRTRQVPPLLSGIKALWEFRRLSNNHLPSMDSHHDVELFTRLATEQHRQLDLPPETLTSAFIRTLLQNVRVELAPVTAVLGGQLAQDVINVLGQREQPLQNFLLFDALDTKAPVYALHPEQE